MDQREKLAGKIFASKIQKTKDSSIEKILDARTFFFLLQRSYILRSEVNSPFSTYYFITFFEKH